MMLGFFCLNFMITFFLTWFPPTWSMNAGSEVGRARLEPATNGFASGGSQRYSIELVISHCHKRFEDTGVPDKRLALPIASHSYSMVLPDPVASAPKTGRTARRRGSSRFRR
jgi:hypothetical protein